MVAAAKRLLALHSYANLDEVKFEHLNWTVEIDFEAQQLQGTAEYTFTYTAASDESAKAPVLVLDTHHLSVEKAFVAGKEVAFELLPKDDVFGSALVIPISADTKKVKVQYATTAASSGLQWLPKELTAEKTHPYLFTQCQAIHARSIVPSPDTPSAKFTYTAHVTVPEWTTVLLSAIADKKKPKATADGKRVVTFHQEVPIPSYLLAVAAGRMESAELGPRSRVWAEPSVVAKAAHEFSQTEDFLKHAEEITGQEYVWKRYDLVCLPPSFPYGGMENPCLTFVTPTLLAGDRSLADVVAHEISHSWTGNLVTNYSWRDFWLNEGWTMWLERKIQTRIYNDPLAYDLKATMGLRDLVESVEDFGATHPYTHLVPDVDGVDPDEVFSSIPYEKGFNFLHYLMTVVGGHDVFDEFAKAYIKHFRFKTLTSEDFRDFFVNYFTHTVDKSELIQQVDWHTWFHTPGMPPVAAKFDTTRTSQAIGLAEEMLASADPESWTSVSAHALKKWPATLWILLLDTLLLNQSEKALVLPAAHVDAIDHFCHKHLSTTHNAELRFRWFTLLLRSKDLRLLEKTVAFLKEQGRMKYVRPLFRDLCKAVGPAEADKIFAQSKALYHPIAAKMIQRDIDDASKPPPAPVAVAVVETAAAKTVTVTKKTVPGSPVKKVTTTKTTTTTTADGVVHVKKDVKVSVVDGGSGATTSSTTKQEKKAVIADRKANHRLAKFLGIPHEYASYSPLAAVAIGAALVATVVARDRQTSDVVPRAHGEQRGLDPRERAELLARRAHVVVAEPPGAFRNARGQSLSYVALFPPVKTPLRGVVIYLHGLGEHSRRYFHLYEQLCEHGFGAIAYDLVSHGESGWGKHKMRAHTERFQHFVDDTNEFIAYVKENLFPDMLPPQFWRSSECSEPQVPLILAGTSFGTLVAIYTALFEKHTFDGMVLVSPAISVDWTPILRVQAFFARPMSSVIPKTRVVPAVKSKFICRDPAFLDDFANDPLTTEGNLSMRMGAQLLKACNALQKEPRFEEPESAFCALPVLFMMGSADKVTSVSLAIEFFEKIQNEDKQLKVFDGMFHALFDDPDKDDVFEVMLQWLEARFPEPQQQQEEQEEVDRSSTI